MQVSLTPKLEEFIAAKIASGRYGDADEVIREALRFMETHEEWLREIKLAKLRREIQQGRAERESGSATPEPK